MPNNWKNIWEKRTFNDVDRSDIKKLFSELKRCNGFDVNGEMSVEALIGQYENIKRRLTLNSPSELRSVYEFGCGDGANLLLFENDGFECGGIDYSSALIDIAKQVLKTKDLICDEAINAPAEPAYDCVLSNSVISYFADTGYTAAVLEKMFRKTRYSIGLVDIHDIEKKDDFIACRKKMIADYEERYADLPKLFYSKSFFEDFARSHGMKIEFSESDVENYWNNDFVFNCFMYKS